MKKLSMFLAGVFCFVLIAAGMTSGAQDRDDSMELIDVRRIWVCGSADRT